MPEGEEKEQEIENPSEKNSERKLPLFGEGNRHEGPGSTEMDTKRPTPRHVIIKMPKSKIKRWVCVWENR